MDVYAYSGENRASDVKIDSFNTVWEGEYQWMRCMVIYDVFVAEDDLFNP